METLGSAPKTVIITTHFNNPTTAMINAEQFKAAMRQFASGITVLSWNTEQGDPQGITVSAFSSLSLDPPLVLFCIDRNAYVYPQLCAREYLAINILAAGQTNLAYQFAGADRSGLNEHLHHQNTQKQPMLINALCNMLVRITDRIPQGDHDIFIAAVEESTVYEERQALLYHNSRIFDASPQP